MTKDFELYFNYMGASMQDYGADGKFNIAGFEARGAISRGEFGIGGGLTVGENVKLNITVEAMQAVK